MDRLIFALNFLILFSCMVDAWCRRADQRFSLGIVRSGLLILLLALVQLYFSAAMQPRLSAPLFFTENVFVLAWLLLALNLSPVAALKEAGSRIYRAAPLLAASLGTAAGAFWIFSRPALQVAEGTLAFPRFGAFYISTILVLTAVLAVGWRLELFWRSLTRSDRPPYKYLVVGFFLVVGTLGWSTAYRLTYLRLKSEHLLLASLLMLLALLFILYAAAGKKILNRKIFVSRKIVYSALTPLLFAVYLIGVGMVSLVMEAFGWPLHVVLQWLLVAAGFLLIAAFAFSRRMRDHARYFISTHFYVNKYEYRDEWVHFTELLHRRLSESGVVEAMQQILNQSLYTDIIRIWIGDEQAGFELRHPDESPQKKKRAAIPGDDPIISYLKDAPFLDCRAPGEDPQRRRLISEKSDFLESMGLVLLSPIAIGEHFVGIIGLGPEYTGGKYGKDDFDLLSAVSSQAASVLLAVRTAEELARAREQSAWHTLSAFVLHDIKNAATMLSLVQKNAPQHIHKPEFQQDMLSSVQDALKRMAKVQARLNTLKGDIEPVLQEADAAALLQDTCARIGRKLPGVEIETDCPPGQRICTDPDFMGIILENLVLNAMEAAGGRGRPVQVAIRVSAAENPGFQIECTDNGPGIPSALLPERLFEPFVSARPGGSGIGLWQVKRLVESLGGEISARNGQSGGARFLLLFHMGCRMPAPAGHTRHPEAPAYRGQKL